MDELIASGVSPSPTPNRETADAHSSAISPVPEGPARQVPTGSLIFADELPDGVVVADEAGRIIVFNLAAARLTGLDPAEVARDYDNHAHPESLRPYSGTGLPLKSRY